MTRRSSQFVLENDPLLVPPLVALFRQDLIEVGLCDLTGATRTGIALEEALLNAVYHGNLEVSSDLRENGDEAFHKLAVQRRTEAPYRDRRVCVAARVSPRRATFVVADQGPGFDISKLPTRRTRTRCWAVRPRHPPDARVHERGAVQLRRQPRDAGKNPRPRRRIMQQTLGVRPTIPRSGSIHVAAAVARHRVRPDPLRPVHRPRVRCRRAREGHPPRCGRQPALLGRVLHSAGGVLAADEARQRQGGRRVRLPRVREERREVAPRAGSGDVHLSAH